MRILCIDGCHGVTNDVSHEACEVAYTFAL